MKRVVYIPDDIGNNRRYILKIEYSSVGIYEEMSPSGYLVHQSWLLIENGKKIQIRSFMNMCYEEILDAIDDSDIEGEYGWKAFFRDGVYIVHKGGDVRL